jgi:16S rRNA (cytidine1402-2'-O)-methyltransferase
MHSSGPNRRYIIGPHGFEAQPVSAGLYLIATPIGNLGDITVRALATLAGVDMILCEDTRTSAKLLERYGIRAHLQPYHDHNGSKMRPGIIEALRSGKSIALISDAGTPLVNDPGFKLVQEAIAEGLKVEMLPGPSAPIMALALSGLPSDRFLFAGFLPPKQAARRTRLSELAEVPATLLFFETAPRIEAALADVAESLPGRTVAVARELTKLYEEVLRGNPTDLIVQIQQRGGLKGEITLVISPPADDVAELSPEELDAQLRDRIAQSGVSKAAAEVAKATGISKRQLYARAVELKNETPG